MGDSQHVSEQSLAASLSGVETTPLALDLLYNEVDKLYHAYARGCGLSDCAYWMLYDIERAGGCHLPGSQSRGRIASRPSIRPLRCCRSAAS